MIIGIDFDNTIVCYDPYFQQVAVQQKLVPEELSFPSPKCLRDYLRRQGREDDWTRLQGLVYGQRMVGAPAYPGAIETIRQLAHRHQVVIISHRTRTPYLGPAYDLHQEAYQWLSQHGLIDLLTPKNIHLELSKQDKLSRLAARGCQVFIDDLPEFLLEAAFPAQVRRILFAPYPVKTVDPLLQPVRSWGEIGLSLQRVAA